MTDPGAGSAAFDLSVIVPSKNCAPYLPTALTSLLDQDLDLGRTQFIFVNDGSTDDTAELLDEWATRFDHVEIISNGTAVGLADGRNLGLDAARGEHIAFLDGDDWLAPGHLAVLLEAIRSLGTDFVRCDHIRVTGKRRELRRAPMAVRNVPIPARAGILPVDQTTLVDYPFAWAGMFHRRLADTGLLRFPSGFMTAEDRPWIWDLHLNGGTCAVIDSPGVCYRRGLSDSLSQVLDERQLYFIPAFGKIFDVVRRDADRDLFLPKAIRNWLAILEHQAKRFDTAPWQLRRQFSTEAQAISDSLPWEVLKTVLLESSRDRRTAVLQMMPHRAELIQELIR